MYQPREMPAGDLAALKTFLRAEHQAIADALAGPVDAVRLVELHAAPKRVGPGLVVLADGTDWNPGSGAGYYGYRGGAWHFLG